MELVVGYIPNHYMALYHARMSEYALEAARSRADYLESFYTYYHETTAGRRTRGTYSRVCDTCARCECRG